MDWSNYYGYHKKRKAIRIIKRAEAQGCRPLDETLENYKWNKGKNREYRLWIQDGLWSLCSAG